MNGFEHHGITHLSPSSLNVWAAQPALWLQERLLNLKSPVGCAAHRGTASESGISLGLMDPTIPVAVCQDHALSEYDQLSCMSGDPRRAKERDGIAGIVATGLAELRQYGVPSSTQGRVEHRFEELPVPIMGFYDFKFDTSNIIVDLKTTLRLPSSASSQHSRQCALYVHASNTEARLAYTTPSKIGVYRVEDVADQIKALVNIGQRLGRFLSLSKDPRELAGLLIPDVDSFWYADAMARHHAREVYGL